MFSFESEDVRRVPRATVCSLVIQLGTITLTNRTAVLKYYCGHLGPQYSQKYLQDHEGHTFIAEIINLKNL